MPLMKTAFPEGAASLARTCQRFRSSGIRRTARPRWRGSPRRRRERSATSAACPIPAARRARSRRSSARAEVRVRARGSGRRRASNPGGSRRRGVVVDEAFGRLVELVELFLDNRLDHVEVDSKVLVCDQIAESDDLRPRDLRSKGASVVRDLCGRLADDDEVVENCITGLSVERASRNMTADGRDGFTYVAETQSLASAHSGTASAIA